MGATMDGRTCLILGAGPGIGRACGLRFAGESADVVLVARNPDRLEELAAEVEAVSGSAAVSGGTVVPVAADVTDPAERERCVREAIEATGRIDAVVGVATRSGGSKVIDGPWDVMREAFELNVLASLDVSRRAAQWMIDHGVAGSIVHVSTLGTHTLPPGQAPYTATKAAMVSASLTMAKELGRSGIRVNVVTPGYVNGAPLDRIWARQAETTGESLEEVSTRFARTAALRRHVDPEDIANAVLFLSGPEASNITGVELLVDAGQVL